MKGVGRGAALEKDKSIHLPYRDPSLEPEWARGWVLLRKEGFSDTEIWDLIASTEDDDWPDEPPKGMDRKYYCAEMLNKILDLKYSVLNEERSPYEWIEDGLLIAYLLDASGVAQKSDEDYRQRQSENSRGKPRNRYSLVNKVVSAVIARLPTDKHNLPGFREHIGESMRLKVDAGIIDVTAVEDERGKTTAYVLEDTSKSEFAEDARKTAPIKTITSAISKINKALR